MRGTARHKSCQSQTEILEQELALKAAHLRARHQNGCRFEVEEVKERLVSEKEDVETELKKVRRRMREEMLFFGQNFSFRSIFKFITDN